MYLTIGEFDPKLVVNHIDGDSSNNSLNNLELCTRAENANRQKCHTSSIAKRNNTSGINGLFIANRKEGTYFCVDITINSVRYCKYFSHKRYGYDNAKTLSLDYLNKALLTKEIK